MAKSSDPPFALADLSIEQKASLSSGASFWRTEAVGGVPSLTLTDGPHGLRKQAGETDLLGLGASVAATCFPPAAGLGQSWDVELIRRVGEALGRECRAAQVNVLLGPGVNIKRHPLAGRNFEYFSEDPVASAAFGVAWVGGIQDQGVGASVKHFAVNNQETDRMRVSADVDVRALREIYLRSFQRVVEEAKPWTVMCAYNRVNGVPASQNDFLLSRVLRDEWGFDGVVVSDWGAVTDRIASAKAGLDLEMPATGGRTDRQLVDAVAAGKLSEAVVDRMARRVAGLAARSAVTDSGATSFDIDEHHALAREAAARSIVLLRNDGGLLPLQPGKSVAVIGEFACTPRFQGGGSSHVNPTTVDVPLEELRRIGGVASIRYARGYSTGEPAPDSELFAEAVATARDADVAVLFLGLPESHECEGVDRSDMDLPTDQLALAQSVVAANPATVVVLSHGGVLRLAPLHQVPAILDGALLGQGGGRALAEVLYGLVNPSGRLSETVPQRIEDTPGYFNFPGENQHVRYGEGLLVGYRWYDTRDVGITFPFGHGLSYTTFGYSGLSLEAGPDGITATVTITNTGERPGREVVQFYCALPESRVCRPVRELKGFACVPLEPGESRTVTVLLRRSDLVYWDTRVDRWVLEGGEYLVWAGASSRDLRLSGRVAVAGDPVVVPLSMESTIGELLAHPVAGPAVQQWFHSQAGDPRAATGALGADALRIAASIPMAQALNFIGNMLDESQLRGLLDMANAAALRGPPTAPGDSGHP